MKTLPYPKTPPQARAWFDSNGISITDWCKYHQLDRYIVTDLLRGLLKGVRGEAHHAAIALGLKPDPTITQSDAAAVNEHVEHRTGLDRRAA